MEQQQLQAYGARFCYISPLDELTAQALAALRHRCITTSHLVRVASAVTPVISAFSAAT